MSDPRDTARRLRDCLNDHTSDIERVAHDAESLFFELGLPTQQRWIELELHGYTKLAQSSVLHEALGVPSQDGLVVHVLSYRVQRGQIVEGHEGTGKPFQHFFVESLHDIVEAATRVRRGQETPLRLDFGGPGYPVGAIFPPDIFERIALGFRATLHLQIGTVLGA